MNICQFEMMFNKQSLALPIVVLFYFLSSSLNQIMLPGEPTIYESWSFLNFFVFLTLNGCMTSFLATSLLFSCFPGRCRQRTISTTVSTCLLCLQCLVKITKKMVVDIHRKCLTDLHGLYNISEWHQCPEGSHAIYYLQFTSQKNL